MELIDNIEDFVINKITVIKTLNNSPEIMENSNEIIDRQCNLIVDYIRTLRGNNEVKEKRKQN